MEPVARAAEFFARHGRDIDKQRFGYHFAGGSQADVIEALSGYQNRDGGFGHGLEVDITAPDSNPFATELALMISLQADIPRDHPVLSNAVGYLEETQDSDGGWRFSAAIYAHQLAPWFRGWQWPSLNPACAIAGLLRELGLGSETLRRRVEGLFRELAQPQDLLGDDYYAVKPYAY